LETAIEQEKKLELAGSYIIEKNIEKAI